MLLSPNCMLQLSPVEPQKKQIKEKFFYYIRVKLHVHGVGEDLGWEGGVWLGTPITDNFSHVGRCEKRSVLLTFIRGEGVEVLRWTPLKVYRHLRRREGGERVGERTLLPVGGPDAPFVPMRWGPLDLSRPGKREEDPEDGQTMFEDQTKSVYFPRQVGHRLQTVGNNVSMYTSLSLFFLGVGSRSGGYNRTQVRKT